MVEERKENQKDEQQQAKLEDLEPEEAKAEEVKGGLWNQPGLRSSET